MGKSKCSSLNYKIIIDITKNVQYDRNIQYTTCVLKYYKKDFDIMKKLLKTVAMLLVFAMLLAFAACTPEANDPTLPQSSTPAQNNNTYADIAGEYLLDGSNLGMPMKWYIKVTADGKFVIATTRDYSTTKGEGTVGSKDGTYMFVYSDSTADAPKTATFTMEGKNMVFSTNIPIGAASLSPNADEGAYPTAKIIACEDIQGTYLGEYVKESAMAGSVTYSYELVLSNGMEYTFSSSFAMMGNVYTRVENGSFAVDGSKISFTALTVDGEAVEAPAAVDGTIADKTIKAAFKLSMMASEAQEIEARLGVYAEQAGTYVGLYAKQMGPMTLSYLTKLELDAFGGYKFSTADTSDPETVDYTEEGTYTVAGDKFTFQSSAEGAAAVEGTLSNYVMQTKFPISQMVPNAVDLSLYADEVSGMFSATAATEAGQNYTASLELLGNAFVLTVTAEGADTPAYVAMGTFEIQKAMLCSVVMTTTTLTAGGAAVAEIPAELATVSAPVAESGINAELLFDLDDAAVLGFQLTKIA